MPSAQGHISISTCLLLVLPSAQVPRIWKAACSCLGCLVEAEEGELEVQRLWRDGGRKVSGLLSPGEHADKNRETVRCSGLKGSWLTWLSSSRTGLSEAQLTEHRTCSHLKPQG